MSMNKPEVERLQREAATTLREHWSLFLVEGIILVILGVAAVIIPPLATLAVTILFGWLFLFSGIVGLITTFWMRPAAGFLWSIVSAIVGIVAGAVLLIWPLNGVLSLTFVLIAFFVIEGVASIMFALDHRRELSGRWEWMLASGVVDLILAAIIFTGLPGSAAWALGLIVGVNMIFGGSALIAMALYARDRGSQSANPAH
ncbi:MAG: HdeD family acid-resistance protein [Roseiarcus sp.]